MIVTIDPQPTLIATCIYYPFGAYLLKQRLFIKKKGKKNMNTSLSNMLNESPRSITLYLENLYEELIAQYKDYPIFFFVECQMKKKPFIALEAFIKGWICCTFPNAIVKSGSAVAWQKVLPFKPQSRKDYAEEYYTIIKLSDDCILDCDGIARYHDIVDCYLMVKYVFTRKDYKKFSKSINT